MTKPTWKDKAKALASLGKRVNLENDGCSSAPDFNFRMCCEEHDFYYRNPESETGVSRWEADKLLRKCIYRRWRLPIVPWLYWGSVRCFGWIPWRKKNKLLKKPTIAELEKILDGPDERVILLPDGSVETTAEIPKHNLRDLCGDNEELLEQSQPKSGQSKHT